MIDNTLIFEKGIQNTYPLMSARMSHMSNMFVGGHSVFVQRSHSPRQVDLYDTIRDFQMISSSHTIQILELNDDALKVKRPIDVKITPDGDQIIAAFCEAEIVTSGEFAAEAIDWLKDMIASTFRLYLAEKKALGPFPKRQLAVLEGYIGEKQNPKKRRS